MELELRLLVQKYKGVVGLFKIKPFVVMRKSNNSDKSFKKSFYNVVVKRFCDFLISLIAVIVLSPVFIITYLLSLIFLGGNPIFKQYRPGKNGKIFPLYKFRSMTNKKDKDGNLLPDAERITWWGKIIRKASLDELPQLFNILAGHMSIVGPRPRLVKDMIFYPEKVMKAYSVRPGLTGPAQVYDRKSEMSWESVFERDLEYAKRVTFIGDLKLFVGTFLAVFKGGSASGSADSGEKMEKREYYYSDYLLNSKQISKQQYDEGIEKANNIIKSRRGTVEFEESLQSKDVVDKKAKEKFN
jgi:lipopolysaccharide/colanic/teichoic acid biosynthesis glycosyltransferase